MSGRRRPSARVSWDRAQEIMGYPEPPARVTQSQFDGFGEKLVRLAETPYEAMDFSDLWYYHHDLAYMDLQPALFAYLFPACLIDWYETLLANQDCSHGDSEFHYGLKHGNVLEKMLTPEQRQEVYDYFRDGLLDRLDDEAGFVYEGSKTPAYGWIARLNSLGLLLPDIAPLWEGWWAVPSPGAGVCLFQYASVLMYGEDDNPFFAPWTETEGGGVPTLWTNDSQIFDAGWLPANVEYLRMALTPEAVEAGLERALAALKKRPEESKARAVLDDFPNRAELVAKCCEELPDLLAMADPPLEWPH